MKLCNATIKDKVKFHFVHWWDTFLGRDLFNVVIGHTHLLMHLINTFSLRGFNGGRYTFNIFYPLQDVTIIIIISFSAPLAHVLRKQNKHISVFMMQYKQGRRKIWYKKEREGENAYVYMREKKKSETESQFVNIGLLLQFQ